MYMYRSYDSKMYTWMYRGYYKIIVVVLLVGQGGHTKVWYGPFGLGLGQGHGESVCVPLYYVHKVNTLCKYIHTVYVYTTILNHAYPHRLVKLMIIPCSSHSMTIT